MSRGSLVRHPVGDVPNRLIVSDFSFGHEVSMRSAPNRSPIAEEEKATGKIREGIFSFFHLVRPTVPMLLVDDKRKVKKAVRSLLQAPEGSTVLARQAGRQTHCPKTNMRRRVRHCSFSNGQNVFVFFIGCIVIEGTQSGRPCFVRL